MTQPFRTRFAPSPTGPLHLGHAYSALLAYDMAEAVGGEFLLRIEDIDQSRSRQHWVDQIVEDLVWLGVKVPTRPPQQSDRMPTYRNRLSELWKRGLLYPCTCSRRDIADAASAPQEGVLTHGPDGVVYPGTCREKRARRAPDLPIPEGPALRLDLESALPLLPSEITFHETGPTHTGLHSIKTSTLLETIGDPVLSRPAMSTSYHLSVVSDDAEDGITHVIRGEDLHEATPLHVALQLLMDLPTPVYHHHKLIRDETGKRLAKRDDARAIAKYRADGLTPAGLRALIGLPKPPAAP